MKTTHLLLLFVLGLFTQTSKAQTLPSATGSGPIIPTSDNLGYVLLQSRVYPFKLTTNKLRTDSMRYVAQPFSIGKPLYAVIEKSKFQSNGILVRLEGEVKLFQFSNAIPRNLAMSDLRAIEAATKTNRATIRRVLESNPIYLNNDTYSITVLRAGVFVYRTVAYAGQLVTMLTVPTDNVPKKPYYFDFRKPNPLANKPICYDTNRVKQISLTYQGSGPTVSMQKPQLESFRFENTDRQRPILGIKPGNADEGFTEPVGYLAITFDTTQIKYIKDRSGHLRLHYKLKGIPTTFTLNIKITFGCQQQSYPSSQIIIYPTDPATGLRMGADETGQPDPTQVGVTPPRG